jgi:hypothetical protein
MIDWILHRLLDESITRAIDTSIRDITIPWTRILLFQLPWMCIVAIATYIIVDILLYNKRKRGRLAGKAGGVR